MVGTVAVVGNVAVEHDLAFYAGGDASAYLAALDRHRREGAPLHPDGRLSWTRKGAIYTPDARLVGLGVQHTSSPTLVVRPFENPSQQELDYTGGDPHQRYLLAAAFGHTFMRMLHTGVDTMYKDPSF